jgi:hypothetical protein
MTDLQRQIELLEQRGNDAELLSLLAYNSDRRARNRVAADRFRLLAVKLRYTVMAIAAKVASTIHGKRLVQ